MKQFKISHWLFSLLFTSTLYLISNAINFDKFTKWFIVNNNIDYFGFIAFFIFGWCFFVAFFILLVHRLTVKFIAIIFIILSAAVTYFVAKYNIALDSTMVMNALHTDTTEFTSLLSVHMIPFVLFLIILPIIILIKTNITFERPIRYLSKSLILFIVVILLGTISFYSEFKSIHRAGNESEKYIVYGLVPINLIIAVGAIAQESLEPYYKKYQTPPKIIANITKKEDLIVVLVIGEASRQKNFKLYGYKTNNTNPLLSKYNDIYTLNGIAKLGSTFYALPEILQKNNIKLASVTKKAGVATACYVNFTMYDNCDAVGEVEVTNCGHNGVCYDEDVLPLLNKNLQNYSGGQNLVILHLGGGSHGPIYQDRYPKEFQRFNPQCFDADVVNQCTIEQLYNSYDNTILYVDYVLDKIIKQLDKSNKPYIFIYLSDHGESLMENGRIFHGMPPGISLPDEQAHIPLLVKSSIPISIVKKEQYLQQDIFDTVLDLLSIQTNVLNTADIFIKKQ